jgi:hypothetical protein
VLVTRRRFGQASSQPSFRDALREELQVRDLREAERGEEEHEEQPIRSILEYATLIPESRYGPIDLLWFPFQAEPFYDNEIARAPEVVYKKSTQVGASTGLWRWVVWLADQFGERAIYFFPTKDDVTDFGDSRIEPSIEVSEYLQSRLSDKSVRRKTYKQVGLGDITLRGMKSRSGVQSVDADAIVIDEYDDCDEGNIAQAERRLSGAKGAGRSPRIRRAGRPSLPGYGMDTLFDESDQRKWLVKCPECGEEQPIEWEENVRWRTVAGGGKELRPGDDEFEREKDVVEAWRACRKCDASLEAPEIREPKGPLFDGRWKAQAKGAGRVPGFHVQRLIVPRTDLEAVVIASRATRMTKVEAFFNADLGIAWAAEDAQLTDENIDAARSDPDSLPDSIEQYWGTNLVTAGLDTAGSRALNIRVSELLPDGRRRAIYLGQPETFEEVESLMERLRIGVLVVDHMSERRHARTLAARNPGRVFLCRYDEQPEADAIRYDSEKNLITVNRTEAIDAMMDDLRHLQNVLISNLPPFYREQMKALKRRTEEDKKERPRKVYRKTGSVGDDYAHAETYDLVAKEMAGLLQMYGQRVGEEEHEVSPEDYGQKRARLGWDADGYEAGFGEKW